MRDLASLSQRVLVAVAPDPVEKCVSQQRSCADLGQDGFCFLLVAPGFTFVPISVGLLGRQPRAAGLT